MYMGGDFGTDNINLLWNQMMSTTTSNTGTGTGGAAGTGGMGGYSTGSGGTSTSMSVPPVPRQSRILMEPDFRLIQALQK